MWQLKLEEDPLVKKMKNPLKVCCSHSLAKECNMSIREIDCTELVVATCAIIQCCWLHHNSNACNKKSCGLQAPSLIFSLSWKPPFSIKGLQPLLFPAQQHYPKLCLVALPYPHALFGQRYFVHDIVKLVDEENVNIDKKLRCCRWHCWQYWCLWSIESRVQSSCLQILQRPR